jgi:hypothetical protein
MSDGPVTPASLIVELSEDIDILVEVAEERKDLTRLGNVFEQLSTRYRALGICRLSAEGDVEEFFQYLVQSALTRRHYLAGVVNGGDLRYRRASFVDPAFDAIAARQWRLVVDVFRLVAHEWSEGEEYEDDFCYAEFVRRAVTDPTVPADDVLARWERALEGGRDLRLDVARSLQSRDGAAFEASLADLLAAVQKKASEMADPVEGSLLATDEAFFPNRWVSIEGLALLAIAERLGVGTSQEFDACPPLARRARLSAFSPKGYPRVPYSHE